MEILQGLAEKGLEISIEESVYLQQSGTVLGASIGSDVVQETLIIGLVIISSALLAGRKSFRFSRKFLIRDYAPMVGTTLITIFLALNWKGLFNFLSGGALNVSGTLTRLDGLILVGSFVAYMYYLYTTRDEKLAEQGDMEASERPLIDLSIGLLMMLLVIMSADVFLRVVEVAIAETGLSGSMIGVATVGVVSAFPEMITAISGLRQGSEGISLGTLVGSNITNPLLAIGSGAVISTYAVPRPVILWDLPMEVVLAGLPVLYMFKRDRIGDILAKPAEKLGLEKTAEKLEDAENQVLSIAGAVVLILLYFVYLYIRFTYFPHD
jgi:cation:H+ antiporter